MAKQRRATRTARPAPEFLRKLQPKLRMIANGSETVNCIRPELTGSIAIDEKTPRDERY